MPSSWKRLTSRLLRQRKGIYILFVLQAWRLYVSFYHRRGPDYILPSRRIVWGNAARPFGLRVSQLG
jgi:hypothetical protein